MTDIQKDYRSMSYAERQAAAKLYGMALDPWDLLDQAAGVERELETQIAEIGPEKIALRNALDTMRTRCDSLVKQTISDYQYQGNLQKEIEKLEAKIARMQPIVDAVMAFHWGGPWPGLNVLNTAADAYEQAEAAETKGDAL